MLELQGVLAEEVKQAAGRGDQDIDAAAQAHHLRIDTDPTVGGIGADWQMLTVLAEAGVHLFGQFAGRHQHKAADGVARRFFAFAQSLQNRQRKTGGLAGARLRRRHQVTPGKNGGNSLQLDRGRGFVAERFERLKERGGEAKGSKGHEVPTTTGKG